LKSNKTTSELSDKIADKSSASRLSSTNYEPEDQLSPRGTGAVDRMIFHHLGGKQSMYFVEEKAQLFIND
jgi:hypothetical protein